MTEMTEQTRRGLLKLTCRATMFGYAALMLIPGARFLIEPLLRKSSQNGQARRVTRLDDLPVDVPKPFAIKGSRGVFDAHGKLVPSEQLGWKNAPPRDMDMLVSGIEVDEVSGDEWVTVVFERFEQGLAQQVAKS
jgi:hypothetical protein